MVDKLARRVEHLPAAGVTRTDHPVLLILKVLKIVAADFRADCLKQC
jgi:hypothetical protein